EVFETAVKQFEQRPFLTLVNGETHNYSDAWNYTCFIANALQKLEIKQCENIIIMLPNSHAAIYSWLASNLINATDVSINTGYKSASLEHAINLSGARLCITNAKNASNILSS